MLRRFIFFLLFIIFIPFTIYTQAPVTVTSIADPGAVSSFIDTFLFHAESISQGIETLLVMNQTLQNQVMALKKLSEGSWDSFVEFFEYQTAAVAGFSQSVSALGDAQGYFNLTGAGYEELKLRAENMSNAMNAANRVVRSTDNLAKMSEISAKMIQQGVRDSASATGPMAALQSHAKILNGLAIEAAGTTQLLYAMKTYDETLDKNTAAMNKFYADLAKNIVNETGAYRRRPASDKIRNSWDGKYLDGTGSLR